MKRRNISRRASRCRSAVRPPDKKASFPEGSPEPNAKDSATEHAADSGLILRHKARATSPHPRFSERIGVVDALALDKFDALLFNRRLVQRFGDD